MTSTIPVPAESPASETSVYFDAPLMHIHLDHTTENDNVNAVTQQHLAVEDLPASTNGEHLPTDLVYENGNWVHRPASSQENSTSLPSSRPASPAKAMDKPAAPAPDEGARLHKRSTTRNGSKLGRGPSVRSYAKPQVDNGGANSAFANGVGTTGYGAGADPDLDDSTLHIRAASADASLTHRQKSKIAKEELKEGRQLTKVIKKESKIEKEALAVAIKELDELQAVQKAAVKAESKAHTAHTTSLTGLQKSERTFHTARTNYEAAQAALLSLDEALETSRRNVKEATQSLQDKMRQVEALRAQKGVDEREREVKIVELVGKKSALKKWL